MKEPQQSTALDALIAQAQRAEPAQLTPLEARRAVRSAVQTAQRSQAVRRQRWAFLLAASLTVVALALVLRGLFSEGTRIEVASDGRPLRVALASGDTLVAAPGTTLEIEAQAPARRAFQLRAGSVLFEVQKLAAGQQFEVHTDAADVQVRGTVFSVEVQAGRTIVRVYEGKVWVRDQTLSVGETWVSSGASVTFESDPVSGDGRAAATLRMTTPAPSISTLPDVRTLSLSFERDAGSAAGSERAAPLAAARASEPVSLELARSWLLAGDAERALAAAQAEGRLEQPTFQLLAAEALRALQRYPQAIVSYRRAAELDPALRAAAGYAAASLAQYELHDAERALELLDTLAPDEDQSALRERASVLRVDVLLALDRREEARAAARRYLEREPETRVSQRMRVLAR